MFTRDNSSIDGIKNTLEEIRRQQTFVRVLGADGDAAKITACVVMLKECVESFLVGKPCCRQLFES